MRKLFLLNLFITALVLALAEPLALYFAHDPSLLLPFLLSALFVGPSVFYIVHAEALRAVNKPYHYVFLNFLGLFLFNVVCVIALQLLGVQDILYVVLAHGLSSFLVMALSIYWYRAQLTKEPVRQRDHQAVFRPALPYFVANSTQLLLTVTGGLALVFYYSKEVAGQYDIAFRVSNLVSMPLFATASLAARKISDLHLGQNTPDLQKFLLRINKLNALFAALTCLGIVLVGEWFLGKFFGAEFTSAYPSLLVLSAGFFLNTCAGSTDLVLQLTGNEKLYQNITALAGGGNLVLNVVLVPYWGSIGAAFAFVATMMLVNGICLIYIRRKLGIRMLPFLP